MKYFKNKYRIDSTRLENWNYGSEGMYFITITTKKREPFFGEIINKKMHLTELGSIAEMEWINTPMIRPNMNLKLGEFVVMPDHFHGIILIGENEFNFNSGWGIGDAQKMTGKIYETPNDSVLRDAKHSICNDKKIEIYSPKNKFGPQKNNVSSICRGFKSAVTTYARINNLRFDWQERFHDKIIRSHEEYLRTSKYIIDNPSKWGNKPKK